MIAKQLAALGPMVDELGVVQAKLSRVRRGQAESIREAVARESKLKAKIRAEFASHNPKRGATITGEMFVAEVGCCENRRKVKSVLAVFKLMGQKAFLALGSPPIGKIEKELSASDFEAMVETAPTGPRSLTVTARF